jgi:hypothetical protein
VNSVGGAIRLITNKPKNENSTSVQITYGEKHRTEFVGVENLVLIDQQLDLRIVGISRSEDSIGHYLDFTGAMKAQGQPTSVYGTLPQSATTQQGCLGSPLSLAGGATVPSANNLSPAVSQVGTPGLPREWMVSIGATF